MKDTLTKILDITKYLGVPQWQVEESYHFWRTYYTKTYPHHEQTLYQRKALMKVYEKYEGELLK